MYLVGRPGSCLQRSNFQALYNVGSKLSPAAVGYNIYPRYKCTATWFQQPRHPLKAGIPHGSEPRRLSPEYLEMQVRFTDEQLSLYAEQLYYLNDLLPS